MDDDFGLLDTDTPAATDTSHNESRRTEKALELV
jgi:hypothetical protein